MKSMIIALITVLTYSGASKADIRDFLTDGSLDAIVCSDLKYDHDTMRYNLSLSIDIEKGQAVEVELKQNYGAVKVTANPVEASADLKSISFGDFTLELSDKQYLNSRSYWGTLKQSDVVVADVVCGFVFISTGE